MNKKTLPYIILFAVAGIILLIKNCTAKEKLPTQKKATKTNEKNRNRGFDRAVSYLEYTQHAQCRMDCRRISKNDIKDIMQKGEINYQKSDVNDTPCPVYAVQGYTNDGEHLRVVFAQCDNSTKIITCYNLEKEFECHCPGDEKKYQ